MKLNYDTIVKNVNIPNILSLVRILILIPFIFYFLGDNYLVSMSIIIVSGLSDLFDGLIARKFNQITKLGAILDPVADKLTVISVVICLAIKIPSIIFIVCLLLLKEFLMISASIVLLKKKKVPESSKWYGKLATTSFYVAVGIIVFLKAIWGIENLELITILMSITLIFMAFALLKYFILFLNILKENTDKMTSHIKG